MESDHRSRLLGMALLLGEISYDAVAASWKVLAQGDRADLLGALLAGIPPEARRSLEIQVQDLEPFLKAQELLPEGHPNTERLTNPKSDPLATQPEIGTSDGSGISSYGPLRHLGARILSSLSLPRWNQYTDLQFLGEGGMGRIFKAFDSTLGRPVALKFLRRVDPHQMTALMNEARNQAQVNHPNICKVFEAKEWQGQLYIAMQFIDGRTLDLVAKDLTELEKVEIMEKVADAMHAAHRQGLIHRDLKPANIMVEQSPEGLRTPFILDFGLARNLAQAGETLDGTIMGTTHYMAPEQARGELSLIGRRTDVYALGATLYELLAGKPPFHEAGELECLRLILEAEIPPLRSVVPEIHPELDTIVMKCLEKEITQRYDSARALAEDLRRFQDGEPILARPSTLFYRASKRARKYRALVVLGAAALVVAGALGAFGLHARVTAASQAQWAQHFGQEAERIEALLRYTRLQPRHDIRFELTQIAERVRTMEAEMEKAGRQARGPGSYALGRAYLALGDPERARVELDRAWSAGFRVPDVSYARGRVLGQLFARALLKARTLQDPGLRRARIQELEETLRDPAVALLRQGRGSTMEPASFQEGLLALYERRYEDALRAARDAARSAPWFYESRALEAEVDLTQARLATDPAAALQHLASAGQALAAAAATAPSDPGLEDLLARRWWEEMSLRRHEGQAFPEQFRALEAACRDWKAIAPDAPGPDARLAWGDLELARISPPAERDDLLHRTLILADTVLAANPDHSEALGALAAALQLQAYAALNAGRDPRLALDRAQTLLQRALQGDNAPFELFEPFAGVLWARVEFERIQGHDPAPAVADALQAIRHLAQRYPRVADFQGFLGGIQVELADYQACHGLDPGPVAARAMVDLEMAIRMAPTRFEFWFSKGNADLALAEYQVLAGLPAEAAIAAGEAAYRSAIGFNSATAGPALGLGELGLLRCQDQESQGRNPLPALAQAEAALAPARALSDNWRVPLFDARAALLRSQWNPDPAEAQAALALAEKKVAQAAVQASNDPSFLVVQAQVQLAWARRHPASAAARILQGRRAIQTALKKDPGFLPAKRLLTDLN